MKKQPNSPNVITVTNKPGLDEFILVGKENEIDITKTYAFPITANFNNNGPKPYTVYLKFMKEEGQLFVSTDSNYHNLRTSAGINIQSNIKIEKGQVYITVSAY